MKPTLTEKISAISIILISLYTLYTSLPEVLYKLTGEFEATSLLKNTAIVLASLVSLFAGIKLLKKSVVFDILLDTCFEEGIYQRLEPILGEIARSQAAFEHIEERLDMLSLNLETFKKRQSFTNTDVGKTIGTFLRTVLLLNATLAVLLFLSHGAFYTSLTPLVLTTLYIVWWLHITYEFNLWQHTTAYIWVFVPILTLPVTTIIADIAFGSAVLISSMALGLLVYAIAYYLWCKYKVERSLPFKLHLHFRRGGAR